MHDKGCPSHTSGIGRWRCEVGEPGKSGEPGGGVCIVAVYVSSGASAGTHHQLRMLKTAIKSTIP